MLTVCFESSGVHLALISNHGKQKAPLTVTESCGGIKALGPIKTGLEKLCKKTEFRAEQKIDLCHLMKQRFVDVKNRTEHDFNVMVSCKSEQAYFSVIISAETAGNFPL